jgi:protein involved in polysaccharide export with SLBB domain
VQKNVLCSHEFHADVALFSFLRHLHTFPIMKHLKSTRDENVTNEEFITMPIHADTVRMRTSFVRWLTAVTTILFCLGVGAAVPQAAAQNAGKRPGQQGDAAGANPLIAEDPIDPKQPLKPSFVINVSVINEPEPSDNYVIDSAGNILVHIAEVLTPISVSGKTPAQAAETITAVLKKYLKEPQVTVSIVSVPRAVVTIFGAVRASGPVMITSTTTLVDILSKAEWTDNADLSQVRLIRRATANGEKKTSLTLHVDTYMKPSPGQPLDEAQNPVLQDKDAIFVPFKSLSGNGVIMVAGEVVRPQLTMPLRTNPPLSLREAINLAGGPTPNANRKAVSVRRANLDKPLIVNLDKAEQNDPANNIMLKPDDTIYIEKLDADQFVNIYGGVLKGGRLPYERRITLTQAIMEAGGIAPFAKDKEGHVLRHPDSDPGNTKFIAFNWRNIVTGKEHDIELQPGDSVWIPTSAPAGNGRDFLSTLSSLLPFGYLFGVTGRRF